MTKVRSDLVVAAIIGDIQEVITCDPDDIDSDDLTDEEIAEFDALPNYELSPEDSERLRQTGIEIFHWVLYNLEMEKRGLSYVDRWEWINMTVKPTVPDNEVQP